MNEKYLMTGAEWEENNNKKTNRCERCSRYYRMPGFIYEPRDKICFSCESEINFKKAVDAAVEAVLLRGSK